MDLINSTYTITDVMDSMLEFERITGELFFDFTLTQVNGKEIKICREKEITESITITNEYDLIIVQDGICITIKRESVMNMFAFVSEHTEEVEIKIVQQ